MENTETQVWLDFALASDYISKEQFVEYNNRAIEIGKLLNDILNNPEKYS